MDMVPDWSSQTQQFQVKKGHNWMVPQKEMQVDHQNVMMNLIKSEKVSDIYATVHLFLVSKITPKGSTTKICHRLQDMLDES